MGFLDSGKKLELSSAKNNHTLVVGVSGTGKTTRCKQLCRDLTEKGKKTLVLDIQSSGWICTWQTNNVDDFEQTVFANVNCFLFIDEAPDTIGRIDYNHLITRTRTLGHTVFILAQRANQLSPTQRTQCSRLIAFRQGPKDAKDLAEDFACQEIKDIEFFEPGEFLVIKNSKADFGRVDFEDK